MPEVQQNQTPVLGRGGTSCRRKEDGPWPLEFWVKAERKRFRHSLETTDKGLAIRTAEQSAAVHSRLFSIGLVGICREIHSQTVLI